MLGAFRIIYIQISIQRKPRLGHQEVDVGQGGGTMAPEISSSPESSAQPLPGGDAHLTLLLRGGEDPGLWSLSSVTV